MKCKPNCAPGGTLSKTRLASCSGGILAGSTGEYWQAAPARYWPDTRQDPPAGYSARSTGELLWDTQRDTRRDPLASNSGILGGMLGGIHWRAALARYSAGSTGKGYSAGYSAGSTGELLWRDTRRDPLASYSGGILGAIQWRASLGYSANARRNTLAGCSGGILGGIHWRGTLGYSAGCSAGFTGGLLWWATRRDPLAGCSGGILGEIYSAGSTGELLWRDIHWPGGGVV